MTRKRIVSLSAILGLAALLLTSGFGYGTYRPCRIQGTWIGSFVGPLETPLILQETLAPQDLAGRRLTYVVRMANPDATFIGMFPYADSTSDLVGEAVRTGKNTYDFSVLGYGMRTRVGDRGEIQYIWVLSGSMECIDSGTKEDSVYMSVFTGDQDTDGDGLPDEDQEPVLCLGPFTFSAAKRVHLMPPCVPPPEGG